MSTSTDPRVYFAAERTLLAWVRTGITVIGLGFVVARFGLFLRVLRQSVGGDASSVGSTAIGVGLVLFGALGIGLAAWNHVRFARQLPSTDRPHGFRFLWPTLFALVLTLIGFALGLYLLMQSET